MKDPAFEVRMNAGLPAMQFHMAQFVNAELEKQKEKLRALAEKAVAEFDVEKEVREMFASTARNRIMDVLRRECGDRAHEMLQGFEISIIVRPKRAGKAGGR